MTESVADGWDCHVHVFDASLKSHGGHYQPVDRTLAEIETIGQARGLGHLVLIQPSVYGTDNSLMLSALAVDPCRHRGVVVLGDDTTDAEMDGMHALGVRGVRFNLVSPAGQGVAQMPLFTALAPRLRRRGWHVQWYNSAAELPKIAELHRNSGLTCVLDHLAGFSADVASDDLAWQAIEDLAGQGAWLKLSGWYRLDAKPPYTELVPQIRRLAGMFGVRLVWGSDWPHTMFSADSLPSYESTWAPVVEALGCEAAEVLRMRQPAIYA